jgi:hypothetical protein
MFLQCSKFGNDFALVFTSLARFVVLEAKTRKRFRFVKRIYVTLQLFS